MRTPCIYIFFISEFAHNFISQYQAAALNTNGSDKYFNEETIMKRICYKKIIDAAELMAILQQLDAFLLNKNVKVNNNMQ